MFSSRRSEVHERAAAAYDDVAQTFDRLAVPIVFTPPAKDLIRLLRLPTMARVLDVGGGTGTAALLASNVMGPGARVVILDLSLGMLRIARRKGLVSVVAGAVPGSPFPDGIFDRVMANFVLSHVPCYRTALSDMVRVLRPGGLLGLTTWGSVQSECRKLWQQIAELFVSKEELDGGLRRLLPWEQRLSDPGYLETILRHAGLEHIEVHYADYKPNMSVDDFLALRELTCPAKLIKELLEPNEWKWFHRKLRSEFSSRCPETVEDARDAYLAVGTKADH